MGNIGRQPEGASKLYKRAPRTRYVLHKSFLLKRQRDREDLRRLRDRVYTLERIVRNMILHKPENLGTHNRQMSNLRGDLLVLKRIADQYDDLDSKEGSKQD